MSEQDGSLQGNTGDVSTEDKQTNTDDYKAKHDALYGKYTAKAEKELELSKKLFKADASEIENFGDSIKNKIVKEEYWYDTFEEAKAVLWSTFYISLNEGAEEESDVIKRLSILEKEKKIAEYKAKKSLIDNKIDLYIATNHPSDDGEVRKRIVDELDKISNSLDVDSRIENAIALVKFKHWSNKDVTFATITSWGTKKVQNEAGEKVERNPELARIFWNTK